MTLDVAAFAGADHTSPVATITVPADGAAVTAAAAVVGTASDANFLRYELALAPAGDADFTVFAEGSSPVTGGTLGTLDPTTLVNDLYTLRLTVFDRGGNRSVATRTVQISGNRKIGLFSLTYQDLNVPASGIPLTVQRTYDSRDKTKGDFGIGWRLGLQTLRLRTNRVLGTGWVRNVSGPTVSLAPTSEHKASLTLPDGRVEEFDMVVSPTSNIGSLDFTNVTGFQPRPGTLGQLQALGNNALLIVTGGAEDELVDDSTLNTYSPTLYRYTTADGMVIDISPVEGVKRVLDPNGNAVTFGPGGILHSNGTGIVFTRDLKGRIVAITDLLGNTQTYGYDGNGDLVTHTDPTGGVSRFAYDRNHGLIDITDAAGNHATRNEYDADGRLIATIDAQGNRVEITHDLDTRQEIVTDRLGNVTLFEYDEAGNIVARTDALGGRTTYTHDSRGNELTVTDPLGRVATRTYDDADNVLTSTDFEGNTTTTSYNARQQVLTTRDPEGRLITNVYDAAGNLMQTTDPEGGVTRYAYDAAGNQLSTTNPLGHVTTYTYDASGNLTSRRDPLDNVTTFTYDAIGRRTSETDPLGRTRQSAYDANGRVTQDTNASGFSRSIAYSASGRGQTVARLTDLNGGATVLTYDVRNKVTRIDLPNGSAQASTYDAEGRDASQTDEGGHTTSFELDALGRETRIVHPDGTTINRTYDAVGRMLTQTDERGNVTTYGYAPNRQTVTDALGNVTVHEFDSQRRPVRTTDALGRATTFAYDGRGNRTSTTFADGTSTTTTYDAAGQKTAETDQAGRVHQFAYDAAGRLIRVTNAAGGITTYTYDAIGNRIASSDANGHVTQFQYDASGRLIKRSLPLGQQETFIHDANGNQISHTDFNGQTSTFTYDAAKSLTSKTLPGGSVVNFAYTGSGLRTQAGGDSYVYDSSGHLTRETKAGGEVLAYTYDAAGNKTSLTTPQGTTTYTYDALNRLATVVDTTGTTTYTYDAVGNLASAVYPSGVTSTYGYDSLNRLTLLANTGPAGLISSYAYTLGAAGNRLQVVEAGAATTGRTVLYAYDAVYRLTQERIDEPGTANDQTITYSYDAVGNRTQMSRAGVVTIYTYDANDRLLTEASNAGTFTSTHDANGNLKTRGNGASTDSYTYDAENRLVAAAVQGGASPGTVSYAYDADGLRTSRQAGGQTTTFLLDKTLKYPQVVVENTGGTSTTYHYGNQLIGQTRTGGVTHFYLGDGQLSTRQLTTPAGVVSDKYTYDAFGVTLASTGSTPNVYLYTGEQVDANVGFYYLRARYYAPQQGRFISADPEEGNIFEPVSLHRYLYANADPVDNRDPSGRAGLAENLVTLNIIATVAFIGVDVIVFKKNVFRAVGEAVVLEVIGGVVFKGLAVGFARLAKLSKALKIGGTAAKLSGETLLEARTVINYIADDAGEFVVKITTSPQIQRAIGQGPAFAKQLLSRNQLGNKLFEIASLVTREQVELAQLLLRTQREQLTTKVIQLGKTLATEAKELDNIEKVLEFFLKIIPE